MKKVNYVNAFYKICLWIMKLAYLNILWVGFTLVGLVFLGLGPSTLAMFSITRKWVSGDREISIFYVFWENYKRNFFKSNALFYIYLLMIYLLSVYYLMIKDLDGLIGDIFLAITLIGAMFLMFIILISLPLYSHAKLSIYHYVKYSAMIVISSPFQMLLLAASFSAIGLVFLLLPGLMPFFLGSGLSLMTMYIVSKIFNKIEKVQLHASFNN